MIKNIYLDGLDKLRINIINLIGGHSLHLYNTQRSNVGSEQCQIQSLLIQLFIELSNRKLLQIT
jgi:hypothetical protein